MEEEEEDLGAPLNHKVTMSHQHDGVVGKTKGKANETLQV